MTATDDLTSRLAKAIRAAWVDRLDWDELAQGALEFLTSTGRLITAGGMALTAEQVEDVRLLAASVVKTNRGAAFEARDRLRALFPATEPAEEFSCTWGTVGCTCDGPLGDVAQKAANAAPAEPAEGETKAEGSAGTVCDETQKAYDEAVSLSYWLAQQLGEHVDDAYDRGETLTDTVQRLIEHIRPNLGKTKTTSSPVVPAPTESGPWHDITKAPKHLTLRDRDGDTWTYVGDNWVTPETAILTVERINKKYAPFVAAKEG